MTREEYKDELRAGVTNYALTVKQAIEAAYKHADETNPNGWHPASEPPVFDEFDNNKEVIGIWTQQNSSAYFVTIPYNVVDYVQYENGEWLYDGSSVPVKYWCYPPKEE